MRTRQLVAALLVVAIGLPALPAQAAERRIRCDSGRFGRYRECRIDTDGRVQLVREFSDRRCVLWRTWGYDRRGIWVDQGCRAEFRVGRDSVSGLGVAAAVIGVLAGAAFLAAIIAESESREHRSDVAVPPSWAQGRYRGFNPRENVGFDIEIARDGTVTGTANDQNVRGYTASGDRLVLGRAEFVVTREPWGFRAVQKDDPENVIYFRKQG